MSVLTDLCSATIQADRWQKDFSDSGVIHRFIPMISDAGFWNELISRLNGGIINISLMKGGLAGNCKIGGPNERIA
ncbi:MAG: hypothetical protein D4R88_08050 [Methanosarcinales archaeon]|nr:MAG: hypothetical protein D4R88_08050 [Methanosarcinales archaeon]